MEVCHHLWYVDLAILLPGGMDYLQWHTCVLGARKIHWQLQLSSMCSGCEQLRECVVKLKVPRGPALLYL